MFMAQVSGNPAIFISTGIKYRGIPDYQTFLRYRDQLRLPHIVVSSAGELANLCGEAEIPGPDPVTLSAEQLAVIEAAAAKGAEAGVVAGADELADAIPTAEETAKAVVAETARELTD